MFGAILITIIPTLLLYIVLPKVGFKIKSNYLRLSFSWFVGMYLFTIASFLLATGLSYMTSSVLFKASLEILSLCIIILFFYFTKESMQTLRHLFSQLTSWKFFKPLDLLIIGFCLLIPILFFTPHLSYQRGAIYISPVFWDFHWLMSLTQTFAYGDNFPPQNEAFAGLPADYHYFWMVITAIYEVLGLNIVQAINFFSIVGFFFFLITIVGICQELFHSKLAGIIAVLLTITSSSARFIDYFLAYQNQGLLEILRNIFTSTKHPFFSAIYVAHGFTYNGTMFNLFYFLEERQMILGVTYLLLCAWIVYNRKHFSSLILLIVGGLMGGYFLWHLYITLMVLWMLLFILLFDKERKQTLLLLTGFGIIFLPHYLYFKHLTNSEWFLPLVKTFPKFDPGFSDQRGVPFSLQHAFNWYLYSYGIKFLLLPISLIWLWFKDKKTALIISAIVIPTFIVLNTIQLSPPDIYENHKWLRPMNVAVDIAIAVFFVTMFFPAKLNANKKLERILSTLPIWIILLFLLTASGIMELMPFFNAKPTQFFAFLPSAITATIDNATPPKSVFVGFDDHEILLAGRKLFLANELRGHDATLNRKRRTSIIAEAYTTTDLQTFCNLTKTYHIDYLEFIDSDRYVSTKFFLSLPYITTLNDAYQKVYFVDTQKACK